MQFATVLCTQQTPQNNACSFTNLLNTVLNFNNWIRQFITTSSPILNG
jgi:hypothetical protein